MRTWGVLRTVVSGDALAHERFAGTRTPCQLMAASAHAVPEGAEGGHCTHPAAQEVLVVLAEAFPGLQRALSDALRTPNALALVGRVLRAGTADRGQTGGEAAQHALELLPVLVLWDAQRCRTPVQDINLLPGVLALLQAMPPLMLHALPFFYSAVLEDVDNMAVFGSVHSVLGLDLVLRAYIRR